jgi:acetyl-CoA acetyltransferase
MASNIMERNAAITGIGQSVIGRKVGRTGLSLTVEAAMNAIADAGLTPADIDGVSTWPGRRQEALSVSPVGAPDIKEALNLKLNWYSGGLEGPGQLIAVINAVMAVVTGQARHVLVYRTLMEATERPARGSDGRAQGAQAWLQPFHAYGAATFMACHASRYMKYYGMKREQLAQIPINSRRNASLNPKAVFREPFTLDDYMSARMVSTPFCLLDCDVPVDGSTAVIVSHVDTAKDRPKPPVFVEAMAGVLYGRDSWDQGDDMTTMAARDAGQRLWQRTDLKPKDVDVAELYDGFSMLSVFWLEALGFCKKGEAAAFIEGGKRIALEGELPLNTNGGQLSAGRMHAYGLFHEACVQLRGEGGARQVKDPQVAAVGGGGGMLAGAFLLRR